MSAAAAPTFALRKLPPPVLTGGALVLAVLVMALVATWAAGVVERRSERVVTSALLTAGLTWPAVAADGLELHLTGTAPTEAARFRALSLAGGVIDAGRLRDGMDVAPARAIEAPRFSVEILRNTDGLSLIGLIPVAGDGEAALTAAAGEVAGTLPVSDMLETADHLPPEGWDTALDFAIKALRLLPRSKISVSADRVAITAVSGSAEEKRRLEAELAKLRPAGLTVGIDISAPRPVLTPFTLRFVRDGGGLRFDACSADTDRARDRILQAAAAAGMEGPAICTVGLGVPTPRWADAAVAGIAAVGALPGATVSFSDADVTLTAAAGTAQADFDRVAGELRAALPSVFSLTATLTPAAVPVAAGPAEFTAALDAEGRVELRGRVTDDLLRAAVDSVAKARFGASSVYNATRVDAELPDGWPVRVMAGVEALAQLHDGRLLVRPDVVEITGVSGRKDASARIAQVLSAKLGPGQTYKVDVRYDEAFDPEAALPTPAECAEDLNAVLAARKITFTPGSAEIDGAARGTLDALAAILDRCPPLEMEIAGHTDSQGSEGGNLSLSQARAEAVLVALQGRGLAVESFVAKGYGESVPIADNGSEAGREANRRIAFTLTGASAAAAAAAGPAPAGPAPAGPAPANPAPPPPPAAAAGPASGGAAAPVIRPAARPPAPATGTDGAEEAAEDAAEPEAPVATAEAEDPAATLPDDGEAVTEAAAAPDPAAEAPAPALIAADEGADDIGVTRSITLEPETGADPPMVLYQPSESITPRPLRRSRVQP
jgi:OOP family OmpA-OmpF porin